MKTELNRNDAGNLSGLNFGKIAQLLDKGTRELDARTVSALSEARRNALSRQRAQEPVFAFTAGHWTFGHASHSTKHWLAAGVLLAIIIAGAGLWHHAQEPQLDDLDVAILTDEMPIEVFVD
ncbi:MAG TPA: DUF3619 family protein [Gallionella sp.]|nr:DUF3619 family protein [Gallionella sp.]